MNGICRWGGPFNSVYTTFLCISLPHLRIDCTTRQASLFMTIYRSAQVTSVGCVREGVSECLLRFMRVIVYTSNILPLISSSKSSMSEDRFYQSVSKIKWSRLITSGVIFLRLISSQIAFAFSTSSPFFLFISFSRFCCLRFRSCAPCSLRLAPLPPRPRPLPPRPRPRARPLLFLLLRVCKVMCTNFGEDGCNNRSLHGYGVREFIPLHGNVDNENDCAWRVTQVPDTASCYPKRCNNSH